MQDILPYKKTTSSRLPGRLILMNDLVLRGVRPAGGEPGDLFLHDGWLVDEVPPGAAVIDADGLIALPGLVDPHCHLREPGSPAETIASGTAAAAHGGFTAVAAMPNTTPACDNPDAAAWLQARAAAVQAAAQVVPVGAVTQGRAGHRLADLVGLAGAGVRLFSDDGAAVASDDLLREALLAVAPFGGVVADHCQNPALAGPAAWRPDCLPATLFEGIPGTGETTDPELWPARAETSIVERDIQIAAETGCRVHLCHLSCAESVEIVRWAKARHIRVSTEVTPHHLFLTADCLAAGGAAFKVNPPLRTPEDIAALRDGLADGTIDMIGTDHAPHLAADKAKPLPQASPGLTGLEQALAVVIETMINPGRIDWPAVTRLMSAAPAQLLGLNNQGRPLAAGQPANLVLIDPTRRSLVQPEDSASLARNNPYTGRDLPAPVIMTIWAGRITYQTPGLA